MPSIIKDTNDFIKRISKIVDLLSDVLLVAFDVISLYPSIPHDFGLHAFSDFVLDHNLPSKIIYGILNMTKFVFKEECVFS